MIIEEITGRIRINKNDNFNLVLFLYSKVNSTTKKYVVTKNIGVIVSLIYDIKKVEQENEYSMSSVEFIIFLKYKKKNKVTKKKHSKVVIKSKKK